MKKNVLAVALALMAGIGAYAEKNTITSPDGKLNVVVEDDSEVKKMILR